MTQLLKDASKEIRTQVDNAKKISLNMDDFEYALYKFNNRIIAFKETLAAVTPLPDAPKSSPALIAFTKALDDILTVAATISDLYTSDVTSYTNARNTFIELDNQIAAEARRKGLADHNAGRIRLSSSREVTKSITTKNAANLNATKKQKKPITQKETSLDSSKNSMGNNDTASSQTDINEIIENEQYDTAGSKEHSQPTDRKNYVPTRAEKLQHRTKKSDMTTKHLDSSIRKESLDGVPPVVGEKTE